MESVIKSNIIEKVIEIDGVLRLVAIPEDYEDLVELDEAIPLDIYDVIYPLYADASPAFWKTLTRAFWDRGLIRLEDFRHPRAHEKIKQSLNIAIRNDILSILSVIQEND